MKISNIFTFSAPLFFIFGCTTFQNKVASEPIESESRRSFASTTGISNVYPIKLSSEVSANPALTAPQTAVVHALFSLLRDPAGVSLVSTKISTFLDSLGFHYQKLNAQAPYNYKITSFPEKFFFSAYLNEVLKNGGTVTLVFDQPIAGIVSRATNEGIILDPIRFLMGFEMPVMVIPHETTHFLHLLPARKGNFSPVHSQLIVDDPSLNVYKDGFVLDEMEAHLGDAKLMKIRGEVPYPDSFLDSQGKAGFVAMLARDVRQAVATIRGLLAQDAAAYIKALRTAPDTTYNSGGNIVELAFQGPQKQQLGLLAFTLSAKEKIDRAEIERILSEHDAYAELKMKEALAFGEFKNLQEAEELVAKQSAPLQ